MRRLMLLTVHLSLLLVFTHSTPVVEPLRDGPELNQDLSQDLSLVPNFNKPLSGTDSTSDISKEVDSTLEHCYDSADGLQPLEKLQARDACYPHRNDKTIDEIVPSVDRSSRTVDRLIPSLRSSDDENCSKFLPGMFFRGKKFLWSVCDSGVSSGDVILELDLDLPGYATYALFHAFLSRFISGQDTN